MDDMRDLVSREEREELQRNLPLPRGGDTRGRLIDRLLATLKEKDAENELLRSGLQEAYEIGRKDERTDVVKWLTDETAPFMQKMADRAIELGLKDLPATQVVELCAQRDATLAVAIKAGEHKKTT